MIPFEQKIAYWASIGTAKGFTKAISLMKSAGFSRKSLIRYGRRMHATGRVYGALWVAEGILAGTIKKENRVRFAGLLRALGTQLNVASLLYLQCRENSLPDRRPHWSLIIRDAANAVFSLDIGDVAWILSIPRRRAAGGKNQKKQNRFEFHGFDFLPPARRDLASTS